MLLSLLLSTYVYAIDPKYETAVNTTKDAILIKTGIIDLKDKASEKVKKELQTYLVKNNMKFLYVIGAIAYPILIDKEIKLKSGPWELKIQDIMNIGNTPNLGLTYRITFGR